MAVRSKRRFFDAALLAILATAGACSSPRPKTPVVINFDVEDYISPESEGVDDIPKWLAEVLSEEGVTGTFFVIGEKARMLERRGRQDVISAMAEHDIGSHTNLGSIHPTVAEVLEKANGPEGVRDMADREGAGFRELERIFGRPVRVMGRHGGSYGPQLVAALGRKGAGFAGSPVRLPGRPVVWFANALNFSGQYGQFDDAYGRDDLFETLLENMAVELPELIRTVEVLPFFAGHPTKIRALEFWDLNYYHGQNPDPAEWKTPAMRPRETMATAQKNFRRLVKALKSRDDVELTTFSALMDRYAFQKDAASASDLDDIARRTVETKSVALSDFFSPAEAFAALAEALVQAADSGTVPGEVKVRRPLGPWETPPARPEVSRVSLADAFFLARQAFDTVERTGTLPAMLTAGGLPIGTGSLFALFCAVYLDLRSNAGTEAFDVPVFDPYPRIPDEERVMDEIRSFKTWPVHRPGLTMDRIVELTKLQLWTLKPARRSDRIR